MKFGKLKTIAAIAVLSIPTVLAESNMTSEMMSMMVEILPIMLIVMVFRMLANSMGGS